MGLSDIGVFEVPVFVAGAVVGCIPLGWNPSNVRVHIGSKSVGAPLPADAKEHGRGRSPLGECEHNRHGIAYNEETTRELGVGSTSVLEGHDGGASLQYALGFLGYPWLR